MEIKPRNAVALAGIFLIIIPFTYGCVSKARSAEQETNYGNLLRSVLQLEDLIIGREFHTQTEEVCPNNESPMSQNACVSTQRASAYNLAIILRKSVHHISSDESQEQMIGIRALAILEMCVHRHRIGDKGPVDRTNAYSCYANEMIRGTVDVDPSLPKPS